MFVRGYTFDDVALIPQYSDIDSRLEPDLSTWLTRGVKIKMPLIPSNMDTVISPELARVVIEQGGLPIFHRFTTLNKKKEWLEEFGDKMFLSVGIKEEHFNELRELRDSGVKSPIGICVDVAHIHGRQGCHFVEKVKTEFPLLQIIAGNICTPLAYHDLVNAGADACKVGIGNGAACLTRMVTGFGVPQFSAIYECAQVAKKLKVPLIADGGIRNSRDVVLALAAGASTVMIGKLFALTNESPAKKSTLIQNDTENILMAQYRGQASEEFQKDYYGELRKGIVAEGESFWATVSGPAQQVIDELLGGLRSGLTYGGARTIKELQQKAEFREVCSTYMIESNTRR